MRFINKSRWNTKDLLKLLKECLHREGEDIREYTIVVKTARVGGITGSGSYFAKKIGLNLPTWIWVQGSDGRTTKQGLDKITGNLAVRMAQVAIHEIGHTRGLVRISVRKQKNVKHIP